MVLAWPMTNGGRGNSDDSHGIATALNNGRPVNPMEHPSVVRIMGLAGNIC